MQKKVKQTKPRKGIRAVTTKGIHPFTERPSEKGKSPNGEGKDASDLFSYFTANIIREEKLFTR